MANHDLPEWQLEMMRVVPDKLVREIVADNQRATQRPASILPTVRVDGAVQVTPTPQPSTNGGWYEPQKIDSWRPPGEHAFNQLMDHQDAIDRAARARELSEVAAQLSRAKAEK
jgi:hypothetical protein